MERTLSQPTKKYIRDLKEQLETQYKQLRDAQKADQGYKEDTFELDIQSPYRRVKTGSGAKIVRTFAQQVPIYNPQVFWQPKKTSKSAEESARKVGILLNNWARILIPQLEEARINASYRGEGFFQIDFNPGWEIYNELPISVSCPDPTIVYASLRENKHTGVPHEVIKFCKMSPDAVKEIEPKWSNPKHKKPKDEVDYIAYWNKDWRYFEADEEALLPQGVQKNIFGLVPLVHFYSGLGKESAEGKPEERAVGVLRECRGALEQEGSIESRIDSIIALWANPFGIFEHTVEGVELKGDEPVTNLPLAPGHNVEVPFGIKFTIVQGVAPPPEMFHHAAMIRARLGIEMPPVALGIPSTSEATGRQEDIYLAAYRARSISMTHNIERALGVALGMCLQIIDTVDALPLTVDTVEFSNGKYIRKQEEITKEDIGGYYKCRVELKPEDELERSRNLMLYRALRDAPTGSLVSRETVLVKGLGLSEEEAQEELDKVTVEQVMDALIPDIEAGEAMERLGEERYLKLIAERAKTMTQQPQTARSFTGNPASREAVRQMLLETPNPLRQPPPSTGGGYGEQATR